MRRPRPVSSRGFQVSQPCTRRGFSLTELLVASTIALVVMAAIAQLFSIFSRGLSRSQATVDLSGRLRVAAWQLRQDLAGLTVEVAPWTTPESDSGYFELIEGPLRNTPVATASLRQSQEAEPPGEPPPPPPAWIPTSGQSNGDTDDVLLFTTRAATGLFTGRFNTERIEAPCAEVAWFCRRSDVQTASDITLYNLYRRQLLVAGFIGRPPFSSTGSNALPGTVTSLPDPLYDVSLRFEAGSIVPNTLADLTKRENRFMRRGTFSYRNDTNATITVSSTGFPYAFPLDPGSGAVVTNATFDGTDRAWEDVILTNVIAFDVRVFDPAARAQITNGTSLFPGDPGYLPASAASGTGALGTYSDLGWGSLVPSSRNPASVGSTFPPAGSTALQSDGLRVSGSSRNALLSAATYDTWPLHYEFNGDDDDLDGAVDEGTNGADDNTDSLPDNPAEYETCPPYPVPLEGIEVRIRCYEPSSQQIRQVTIRHTFKKK